MARHMAAGVRGEGAWIAKILGGFMGVVFGIAFRLPFALLMIPIQAVVSLGQSKTGVSVPAARAKGVSNA